jgi:hypothetical protein
MPNHSRQPSERRNGIEYQLPAIEERRPVALEAAWTGSNLYEI